MLKTEMKFVGMGNFRSLLKERVFWNSLGKSLIFTFGSINLQFLLGMGIAMLLNQRFKGRAFARGMILFPYLIPTVAAVLVWKWILDTNLGILNHLLFSFHLIREPISWLGSPDLAMIVAILVNTWKFFPFVVISVLAGLQGIPEEIYEAAKIDGASFWRQFIHITLPQLKYILMIVFLLRFIWTFNNFDLVYVLTGGGPINATETTPILIYEKAFFGMNMGMASSLASVLFLISIGLFVIYMKLYFSVEKKE